MDLRGQQIIVQQHMNDRLTEARMARLAREARDAGRALEQAPVAVVQATTRHHRLGALEGFFAAVVDAASLAGRSLVPAPTLRVRVVRR